MLGRNILFACVVCLASPGLSSILSNVFPNDVWVRPVKSSTYNDEEVTTNEVKDYKICETKDCKQVADEFVSGMNKSVDPCEDFYEYTCGGWAANRPIPPSLPVWSRFMIFQNTVHYRIKEILETKPEPSDILPVRQAKKWYRSCMDTEALEERGMKPIESILLNTGGWPMTMDEEEWDKEMNDWQDVELYYARLTGTYTFYKIEIGLPEELNDKIWPITMEPQELPLTTEMPIKYRNYSGNDYETYVELVYDIANMFTKNSKANVPHERLMKEAKELVEFEKDLFQIQQISDFEDMTLKDFHAWYRRKVKDPTERINFRGIINSLFDMVNYKVVPETTILLKSQSFVKTIGKILSKTPTKTIVNYIHWNFVASMLTSTTEAARDRLNALLMKEYGTKERLPRWSECVTAMKMTNAAAYVFVQKYITEKKENAVSKMAENIRNGLEEQMKTASWLDEESRKLLLEKLEYLKVFVGFPDWYKKKEAVLKSYKGLTIGNELFDNVLSFTKYSHIQNLKAYRNASVDVWLLDPITINAGYIPVFNSLIIPAADFQAPLLTPNFPEAVNYGILGVLLGHEIGHGFDIDGIQFGKDGNLTRLPEVMLGNYFQRAMCFVFQYDKLYNETGPRKKGEGPRSSLRTSAENIADSTGVQAVYRAFQHLKKSESSVRLPGLEEYTDDQLFYIAFGAMWCEISTPEFKEREEKEMDEHSPSRIRVIGAVSNAAGFAEAFNCPIGSPMNPAEKCGIWENTNMDLSRKKFKNRRIPNRWEWQWNI